MSWIGRVLVLLAFMFPGSALAQSATPLPPEADAATRARWATWIGGLDRVRVVHVETLRQASPFPTRRPSEIEVRTRHEDTELAGPRAQDVLAVLARQLAQAPSVRPRTCPVESIPALDEITFTVSDANDELLVTLEPQRGMLVTKGAEAMHWSATADSSQRHLLERLATVLVDDVRLGAIHPCETPPDSAPADGRTDLGAYVWVETMPEIVKRKSPEYPEESRREGFEATIAVRALVGRDGRIQRTRLEYVSPDAYPFQRSAVHAVEQFEFRPATSNGRPIEVWVTVPIRFVMH